MQADHFASGEWRLCLNHAILLQGEADDLSVNELHSIEPAWLLIQQGDYLLREGDYLLRGGDYLLRGGGYEQAVESMEQAVAILDHQSPRVTNQSEAQIRMFEFDTICKNNLASILKNTDAEVASRLFDDGIRSAEKRVQERSSIFRHRMHLARVIGNSASLAMEVGDLTLVHWKREVTQFAEFDAPCQWLDWNREYSTRNRAVGRERKSE